MSYFIAISGPRAATLQPIRGALVAVSQAQPYFRALEQQLALYNGGPVFLWDDAESDTSDDLVCEACDEIQLQGKREPELAFAKMLTACADARCSLHVWWPARLEALGGLSELPMTASAAEALQLFVSQATRGVPIGFVLQPAAA